MNSRISISLDGKCELANHSYSAFSIQPLVELSGKVNLDNASFYLVKKMIGKLNLEQHKKD